MAALAVLAGAGVHQHPPDTTVVNVTPAAQTNMECELVRTMLRPHSDQRCCNLCVRLTHHWTKPRVLATFGRSSKLGEVVPWDRQE